MKKGICLGCIPGKVGGKDLSVKDKFKLAADAGFDGIEINGGITDEQAMDSLAAAKAAGIEIHSIMGGPHWQFPMSDPDDAVAQKCVEGIAKSIEQAAKVGATAVLLVPGVVNEKVCYEEAWKNSIRRIKQLVPVCVKNKVVLGLENVWNKFLLSPMEMCQYIDGFKNKWVQGYFDVGNILLYGYPQQWIRSLGKRIKKVHVKNFKTADRTWVWLLEGDVPWPEVMTALRDVGYDDYLTVEIGPYKYYPDQFVFDVSKQLDRIING